MSEYNNLIPYSLNYKFILYYDDIAWANKSDFTSKSMTYAFLL